jgi:hypothetical protein
MIFFLKIKILWINNFQCDLTEALVKLNRVPLASDEDPVDENIFYIYIKMTGKIL